MRYILNMKISKKCREHFAVDVVEREIKSFFFFKIKREEKKIASIISRPSDDVRLYLLHVTSRYITKHTALGRERSIINIIRNI